MNLQTFYKLKSKFVTREVGNELILVPLVDNVAKMSELFTLNETAKFIWENSKNEITIQDMESLMTDSFKIDKETAGKDIASFLNHMESLFKETEL